MRVIAGEYKGRVLSAVAGKNTRPTGDKVKEAIFHKLGPFFTGGNCLDLFAGSGSLGIEALSRGMDKTVFIDQTPQAVKTIHKNLEKLKIENCYEVYRKDAFKAIKLLTSKQAVFDLILIDPPYEEVNYNKVIEEIVLLCKPNTQIFIEYSTRKSLSYDETIYKKTFEKQYNKTTSVVILQKL